MRSREEVVKWPLVVDPHPSFTQGMDDIWHKVVTQLLELSLMVSWEKVPAEGVSLSGERIQVFEKVRRCRAHKDHGIIWLLLSGIDAQWWAEGKLGEIRGTVEN